MLAMFFALTLSAQAAEFPSCDYAYQYGKNMAAQHQVLAEQARQAPTMNHRQEILVRMREVLTQLASATRFQLENNCRR